ncbi:hypothetical protein SAMN05518871_10476 [Psychrobacillus sp. OK028]|uniref:hypothetical protein n=1 Tax=unclassified Psychrobacillus TaxID=2636677 RepID=UPI00088C4B52|nr:hypothetical protein [Psychrobacillus sp. OK028]SDN24807.1 hypothetical protein SAMN05518871_10476 [Psychrobacillus sp. OK028]
MRKPVHFMVIVILLLLTIFLYNKQLASIPLLLISFYLFVIVGAKISLFKKNK